MQDSQNIGEYFGVSCNNKSNWEWMYERQVYVAIHRDLSVVGNCKGGGLKGSRKTSESIFGIFWRIHRSSEMRGSPEGIRYENLELELAKSLTRKDKKYRTQSKDAE